MCSDKITEEDEEPLANAILKNDRVIEIVLQGNPICKTKKCSRLFDTICKMRTCENSSCCVQDPPETLRGLVDILKYVNTFDNKTCDITRNIEHLDISNICQPQNRSSTSSFEEDEGAVVINLIQYLKLFGSLKTLNLSHALNFSDVYVALDELAVILKDNDTLLELDISDNDILAKGTLIILESLEKNETLKKLNLTYNKISGDKKCEEIAYIIRKLRHIGVDILKGNEFTERSKRILGLY